METATNFDVVVAGAGVWGCTIARVLAEGGHKVRVIESRSAVGGNVRCEIDAETGIEIHTYGSHIFHTHIPEVWDFVRRFVEFNGYQHKVLARYQGRTYYLPLSLALINKFFGVELAPGEVADFMRDEEHSRAIFDAFFRGYTSKQWGKAPEEIDPSIIKRVPVRDNYDVNYFKDTCQGIPMTGYNSLFDRLLDHPNITVEVDHPVTLAEIDGFLSGGRKVFYSGPIDKLFDYRFGALPWRSLRFETERIGIKDYQGTSVVNYTEAKVPWTRIHEFKHYHPEDAERMAMEKTVIMREYPADWKIGDEPYYPIANPESEALLARYRQLAASRPQLFIGGRLGQYKYYDMDQAMGDALKAAIKFQQPDLTAAGEI